MIMKKLIILAAVSLAGSTAFAQIGQTDPISPVKVGLKAGVSLPNYHFADNEDGYSTDAATNFHITGYIDAPIGRNFSVQPGLSLQGKGAKLADAAFLGEDVEVKQNTLWLEVPVNFVGKVPMGPAANLYLGAGPYAAFGLSGKNDVDGSFTDDSGENPWEGDDDFTFGDDSSDNLKGTDFGVNFIGGIQLNSGFNVGAGYGLGLTDLRPGGDGGNGKQTNRVWTFSVGFAF